MAQKCNNWIGGEFREPSTGKYMDVESPATGEIVAQCAVSGAADVDAAVQAAKAAFPEWSQQYTMKRRALALMKFHELLVRDEEELAKGIVLEHGKSIAEARADVIKGNETVEYACSLPQIALGRVLEVSRGVTCQDSKEPLGVVGAIVPFNFPVMVPMWTLPISIGMGNCVVMKPSEKVPMSMTLKVSQLLREAGIPDGVVNIVNGTVDTVNALCDHREIAALTFVGSSKVAGLVEERCAKSANRKRCIALGGAKNHMVAMPDANIDMTAADVTASFTGCTGQRCMAATVLVTVGQADKLVDAIVAKAAQLKPGQGPGEIGPVIDQMAKDRILGYINQAEKDGAKIVLDGRSWAEEKKGYFVGPTIICHTNRQDPALHDEIFGPVLSIIVADSKEEAIQIENACPYGNAACIYTSAGAHAEWFQRRFTANMIGINIGVPVPREPFSFGGMGISKFGQSGDITGEGAIEFFSRRKKITSKWVAPAVRTWMD